MTTSIPTIDLEAFRTGAVLPSPEAKSVARHIDGALRQVGFLLVTGHGVGDEVRAALLAQMRTFFARPLADKERIAIGNSPCHRGYVGVAAETLQGALGASTDDAIGAGAAGDLKETIDSGIEHGDDHPEVRAGTPLHGPNQLPDLPGFREAWNAYFSAATEAVLRMQRGLAMALGLAPGYFETLPGETMRHLRMVHYPATSRVTPGPGQLGCGVHTDYGSLTVLADDGVGGLQVRQRDGTWTDVEIPPGELVVNLGDLMSIWTNDRWVSNPHRVVNPPDSDRYSIVLFVTPPFHLRVETLPTCLDAGGASHHAPLISGPYLLSRFDGTHSYRNPLLERR